MTHVNRVLDRRPSFDERSRQFNIRPLLTEAPLPRSYTWWRPEHMIGHIPLDQGSEGACVGYAFAHEAAMIPVTRTVSSQDALYFYREARKVDEWPGEDYDGTSILAGAKVYQARGFMTEYRWAFTLTDALTTVSRRGPVVLGLNWYTGMMEPDGDGYIHQRGVVEGGHAILMVGVNVALRRVKLMNSWGSNWGLEGFCYLDWSDLGQLLSEQGECCVPVHRLKMPPQRQP